MPVTSPATSQRGHVRHGSADEPPRKPEWPPGVNAGQKASATENHVPSSADTTEALIDLILTRYHAAHRRQLPELVRLARLVEKVHGGNTAVPQGLAALLEHMAVVLEGHMQKEERVLFPIMRRYDQARLAQPIAGLLVDHDDHAALLRKLETLTDRFEVPEGACGTWRALYAGSRQLAEDLVRHIQIENDLLFPRFVKPSA